ncbi:MAG: Zn-dependent hydrolase [Sphingorhabdus sp.]
MAGEVQLSSYAIDRERLWNSLEQLGQIGGTANGGVCRLAYSAEDRAGKTRFIGWCEELGMTISTDAIGNLFAYLPGTDVEAPVLMIGSHLDSQPTGGKYDGAYGVMSGLEVLRQLRDDGVKLRQSVELVSWANEEGARFQPALMGSSVFAGVRPLDEMLAARDEAGIAVGEALNADPLLSALPHRPERPIANYLEIHIEQGPVLETEDVPVGVVRGVQAIRWYEIEIAGEETHAGPPPMDYRRDALMTAAEVALAVEQVAKDKSPDGRGMVGQMQLWPGSRNVVPGRVFMTADLRHPEDHVIDAMDAKLREMVQKIADRRRVSIEVKEFWRAAATPFDPEHRELWHRLASSAGVKAIDIVSGAGHDAVPLARVARASMLFIPCKDGKSHNELESITSHQAALGCSLLYDAVRQLAG